MSKRIMIIDGGPRKRFSLAALLDSFTQGVKSVDPEVEVEHVYLYDVDYKGCVSCMACKVAGGKNVGRCLHKDGLSGILERAKESDGLAFGSPVYFSFITGQLEAALERLTYPWLSYNEMRFVTEKRVPTATFYTMNATPEQAEGHCKQAFDQIDGLIGRVWTQPERVCAYNTTQVKDYLKYDLHAFSVEAKQAWRNEHFPQEKQHAFDAGQRMAEKILNR